MLLGHDPQWLIEGDHWARSGAIAGHYIERHPQSVDEAMRSESLLDRLRPFMLNKRYSIKSRLAFLIGLVSVLVVAIVSIAAFSTVRYVLYQEIDRSMRSQAQQVVEAGFNFTESDIDADGNYVPRFRPAWTNVELLIIPVEKANNNSKNDWHSDVLADAEMKVVHGEKDASFRNEGQKRILAIRTEDGRVIVMSQDISSTQNMLNSLSVVLVLIGLTSSFLAVVSVMAIVSTGLHPLGRLRRAADYVTKTDDLRPIPVEGEDEIAVVATSFNNMLAALERSRDQQRIFVADASHELKTPLTSLKANIELLMMVSRSETMELPQEERESLEKDIIAQIDEMSILIYDMLDLAREDLQDVEPEAVDYLKVVTSSLERVQRRRPDVVFDTSLIPWYIIGDEAGLGRAILNLLDNAAKWSPQGGTVRLNMTVPEEGKLQVSVADSGPGVPVEDRDKIFGRFYRSIDARSMPGSGLGLAIVDQVVSRHHGEVHVEESDDGGALFIMTLPGHPILEDIERELHIAGGG